MRKILMIAVLATAFAAPAFAADTTTNTHAETTTSASGVVAKPAAATKVETKTVKKHVKHSKKTMHKAM